MTERPKKSEKNKVKLAPKRESFSDEDAFIAAYMAHLQESDPEKFDREAQRIVYSSLKLRRRNRWDGSRSDEGSS
jgi:hypothetical protein